MTKNIKLDYPTRRALPAALKKAGEYGLGSLQAISKTSFVSETPPEDSWVAKEQDWPTEARYRVTFSFEKGTLTTEVRANHFRRDFSQWWIYEIYQDKSLVEVGESISQLQAKALVLAQSEMDNYRKVLSISKEVSLGSTVKVTVRLEGGMVLRYHFYNPRFWQTGGEWLLQKTVVSRYQFRSSKRGETKITYEE